MRTNTSATWPPAPSTVALDATDPCAEVEYRGHRVAVDRIVVDGRTVYRPLLDDDYVGDRTFDGPRDAARRARQVVDRRLPRPEPVADVDAVLVDDAYWSALRDEVRA